MRDLLNYHFPRRYYAPDGGGGGSGTGDAGAGTGSGGGTGTGAAATGATGSGSTFDPTVFARSVAEETRKTLLAELGVSSMDELKASIKGGRKGGTGAGDADDIKAKNDRIAQLEAEKAEAGISEAILRGMHGHEFHDADMVRQILKGSIVNQSGSVYIKGADGNPLYNKKGDKMTVSEYMETLKSDKPFLFKAPPVAEGAGITPGGGFISSTAPNADAVMSKDMISMDEIDAIFKKK